MSKRQWPANRPAVLTVLTLLCLLAVATPAAIGQSFDPFLPTHPIVLGRGGSFIATANGYNTFFFNPAGFAADGEFTLASATLWAFTNQETISFAQDIAGDLLGLSAAAPPVDLPDGSRAILDPELLEDLEGDLDALTDWIESTPPEVTEQIIQDVLDDPDYQFDSEDDLAEFIASAGEQDIISFLESVEAAAADSGYPLPVTVADLEAKIAAALPSGYVKAGAMAGIGYAGGGIGLGVFANVEGEVDGSNLLQATGTTYNTITFVGGLGLSFGSLDLGVALRPIILGYSDISMGPLIAGYLSSGDVPDLQSVFTSTVYFGSGLAVDVGAKYHLGPFAIGVAVKDLLGTRLVYRKSAFDDYLGALQELALPNGEQLTDAEQAVARTIPMKTSVGVELHPDLGAMSKIIDPSVSADIVDLFAVARAARNQESFVLQDAIEMVHVGGQVRLLDLLNLQAGYYGGYLAGGVGLRVLFIDVNAAVAGDFGRTDGAWGFTNVGGSLEVAIRF